MKKVKGLVSLILSAVLVFNMCFPVFAENEYYDEFYGSDPITTVTGEWAYWYTMFGVDSKEYPYCLLSAQWPVGGTLVGGVGQLGRARWVVFSKYPWYLESPNYIKNKSAVTIFAGDFLEVYIYNPVDGNFHFYHGWENISIGSFCAGVYNPDKGVTVSGPYWIIFNKFNYELSSDPNAYPDPVEEEDKVNNPYENGEIQKFLKPEIPDMPDSLNPADWIKWLGELLGSLSYTLFYNIGIAVNNILVGIVSSIVSSIEGLKTFFDGIIQGFKTFFEELLPKIFIKVNETFKSLFIPDEEVISLQWKITLQAIIDKWKPITDSFDTLNEIYNKMISSDSVPSFDVKFGDTVFLVSFSSFETAMKPVRIFFSAVAWLLFIKFLSKDIPSLIGKIPK